MRIAEQITSLESDQAKVTELMTALASDEEGLARDLNEDEQALFNEYSARIESCEQRVLNLRKQEIALAKLATPVKPVAVENVVEAATAPSGISIGSKRRPKGCAFVAEAAARFCGPKDGISPADYARRMMDDHELAAWIELPESMKYAAVVGPGGTKTTGYVEEMTSFRYASEQWIELLRPMTIIGRLPVRRFDFGGDDIWHIPRQTGSSTGYWVGENVGIPTSKVTIDQPSMNPRKAAALSITSQESLRRTTPGILEMLRDDQLAVVARTLDAMFMSSTARAADDGVPGGLFKATDSTAASSTWASLALITADLKAMKQHFDTAELSNASVTLIMSTAQENELLFIRDTNGNLVFADEMLSRTSVMGMPYITSNQVADATFHGIAASDVLHGTDMAPRVETSTDASIYTTTAEPPTFPTGLTEVQNLFQDDGVAIKTTVCVDWIMRHATSSYHLTVTGV